MRSIREELTTTNALLVENFIEIRYATGIKLIGMIDRLIEFNYSLNKKNTEKVWSDTLLD